MVEYLHRKIKSISDPCNQFSFENIEKFEGNIKLSQEKQRQEQSCYTVVRVINS